MQQFQSLQRLLIFYALTLLVMLALYYVTIFHEIKKHSEQHSIDTFYALQHEVTERDGLLNPDIKKILEKPVFEDISYQLVFMMPSGQTYIHRHTRPNETAFSTVTFPIISSSPSNNGSHSAYTLNNRNLTGTIKLKSGHQLYIILRHKPPTIEWISYRYWLPLMAAIILFIIALLYMLNRRANWEQLLLYTDNLSSHAKEAYSPPPFLHKKSTTEFLRLGHALSRVSYQLHNDYRRIKTLTHRLERLVDQAPLPMLMIMRHGQVSFFNKRFEQTFMSLPQSDSSYELTDFIVGKDESTQRLLQTLSNLRFTRTLIVYGLKNKQAYQLHITPWFGEHGQVHGFTVLLNNINEFANQVEQLQQHNQQLQRKLDELNKVRSLTGHQLRIPLEMMIDTLEPIDPATLTTEQNDILISLIKSSQNMLTTLNDVLDIGEIEVRKTRLNIEPVDIYKLGQEINDSIIGNTRQQGLELIYFFAPDCPRCIDTDDIRLRQILLNLLKNAVKFTTSGYVALTIETVSNAEVLATKNRGLVDDHTLIKNSYINKDNTNHASNDWIRFSIKDSGMGIDIAKQHQLLTYLNEGNNQNNNRNVDYIQKSTTEKGLGLSNVNSFARLLGGFIEIKSTVTKGSTFNLYLPCRCPNYQPVYHHNQHLTQIYLIAVINQPLVAENLQRLCEHLSISTTICTSITLSTIENIVAKLAQNKQTLAPILLLDYEYYETVSIASANQAIMDDDRHQALNILLDNPSLPKILFSMKPERRIPSILLDKYEGFLTKPLDATLLLSELLRLTLPARQNLVQTIDIKEESKQLAIEADKSTTENVSPLILVVEDSPTNQKITCKILSKLGYRSVVAEDGQQALDTLQQQRQDISLILMDCRMPVMDGLQATQAIRAQGDKIAIVALTANNTKEDRDACIEVGMDDFLSKPINKKELEAVLQSFIKS
ncbi:MULTISPECIES: response regulator [Psychrobacter]|uniref:response regulator n=1 Tax=Psychrobacter TaxID=497 RepID=UPI000ECE69A6|nr:MULTISPECIES: hybrid sensor histidine kinase/response regulator [Psychrobacter]HCT74580.1 histidine kinase [Psychrobacter sp.]